VTEVTVLLTFSKMRDHFPEADHNQSESSRHLFWHLLGNSRHLTPCVQWLLDAPRRYSRRVSVSIIENVNPVSHHNMLSLKTLEVSF